MTEEREEVFYGLWSLPESKIKAQGRLTVSNNFIDLYLTDPNHSHLIEDRDPVKIPMIYGIGNNREFITLYDCEGFSGSYHAKIMLYGDKHYDPLENLRFPLLSMNLPYFDKWINPGSFKKEVQKTGFIIKYENPKKISFDINESFELMVDFSCFIPATEDKTKIHLNQYSSIQLISKVEGGSSFNDFMANVKYLQQFISFINRDGANIDVIRVHSSQNDFERNRYLGTMVYAVNDFNKFAEVDYANHPLIKYNEISEFFSSTVKNWFVFAKNGQHIIGLILQDYFYRGAFDENRFLNLVRALEIFHAFKDPTTKLPAHEFELKLAEIVEHVPEKYKKEVLEDLKYTNHLTLNMRLKALIGETENNTIGYDTKLDKKFINDLKNSRNYYTHYNPTLKKQALKGGELEKITETCRTLLNYLILKYLGVPQNILAISFQYYFESSYYSNYFN